MPLFICAKCGCVENTALSTYWSRNMIPYSDELKEYEGKPLCSECGRAKFDGGKGLIVPGRWHGYFPKVQATEEQRQNMRENGRFEY